MFVFVFYAFYTQILFLLTILNYLFTNKCHDHRTKYYKYIHITAFRWFSFPVCYLFNLVHKCICFQSVIWSVLFNLVHTYTCLCFQSVICGVLFNLVHTLVCVPVCYLERSIYSSLQSGLCPDGCNRLQERHKQDIVSWLYMQNS